MDHKIKVSDGQSYPLGATVFPKGTNFCLFTKNASAVELLLFDPKDRRYPSHTFRLSPRTNKTFYYWHIFLEGVTNGQLYGWKVHGPYVPEKGYRFDSNKVLIDPYARAVDMTDYDRSAAIDPGDNSTSCVKSVVVDPGIYDWEGDKPLNHPFSKSIIYELHVGGFTKHKSAGIKDEWKGTYRGLIEKIPYLKALGITSVELLPVQQFDPFDVPDNGLTNYWGYSPIAFFAPHAAYGSTNDPLETVNEFRDMVKALHKAGIEVILDVVFNHTGEGNQKGPILSFRGIENKAYYMFDRDNNYEYKNFSGTGNTINGNHSVVRRMIRDCLKHWVSEMHVDGFRFDLASVLSRDEEGIPSKNPPILWEIESDPVLASTKLIAEAWDIHQYQLGNFIGDKWAEWNGAYRDDIRRFIKGDGYANALSKRLNGSHDLFQEHLRNPNRSINFITCHDGFTLNDLVSYNEKHNEANGEENRDGHNENYSWNCGVEGPTTDQSIKALRLKQAKNFLTIMMVSQGTPMLLMGDEVLRTQGGNNNAYCQDNEIGWFDWDQLKHQQEMLRFTTLLNEFNLGTTFFQEEYFWNSPDSLGTSKCIFHGTMLNHPDLGDHSHSLAFTLKNRKYKKRLHVMINAYWEALDFEIPLKKRWNWKCLIDTAAKTPNDILKEKNAPIITDKKRRIEPRSVVVLQADFIKK